MTLNEAKAAFAAQPDNNTANNLIHTALAYEEMDIITDDELFNILADVEAYLKEKTNG